MRVLGVDLGRVRIGIALGETTAKVATPRPAIAASGKLLTDAEAIAALATREEAERIIVGQPLNEEDDRMARICGMLADHLRGLGWHVELVDESFTSMSAEANLRDLKGSIRRRKKDGEAAALILERYFDGQTGA